MVLAGRSKEDPKPGDSGNSIAIVPGVPEQVASTATALADQFMLALASAAPRNRDAVVLRLKAGKDSSIPAALDVALAKAGISAAGTDTASLATLIQEAYAKTSPVNAEGNVLAAADAVFMKLRCRAQSVFAELGTTEGSVAASFARKAGTRA
jgi:hypothetical protein